MALNPFKRFANFVNPFGDFYAEPSNTRTGAYDPYGSTPDPSPASNALLNSGAIAPMDINKVLYQTGLSPKSPYASPGASTGGGAGTGGGNFNPQTNNVNPQQSLGYFMGKEYFDPAELYRDQLNYLDSTSGQQLGRLRQGKQRQLEGYGRQKSALETQLSEILEGYGEQEKQGLGNIANYYNNLGDLYQSSQGTRESDLRSEVGKARTKSQTQANEGRSAIERAIAEYLDSYGQSEQNLGTQYQSARDALGGGVVSDLQSRLGVQEVVGRGVDTGLAPEQLNTNSALIGNLQGLKQQRFNNPFQYQGSGLNLNPILQYLAGLGA